MNKIWIYILALTAFISCNKIEEGTYKVEANAVGIEDGKKVFVRKAISGKRPVIIDTLEVLNEKFSLEGEIDQPRLHLLSLEGERSPMTVIIEEGKIKVDFYKDSIPLSKVSGTTSNDDLYKYISNSSNLRKKIQSLREQQVAAKETGDAVTLTTLNETYAEVIEEVKSYDFSFVKENSNSYMAALLVEQMLGNNSRTPEEILELFNGLSDDIKGTDTGISLSKKLADVGKLSIGAIAPDFTGPTPTGEIISLKESLGKLTILDFWAAWCKPCRAENPNVVALYNDFHDKGLNIVGVSLDRKSEDWKKAIEDDSLTWSHVSNLKFWQDPIAVMYNIRSIPATYLLDADGKIIAKNLRGEDLRVRVEELLSL